MKDLYADFLKDESWFIKETKWSKALQDIRESQFALGNGHLGIRGVLEEIPPDASAGTHIAGVYDRIGSQVDELVNLPNPVNFKFTIEGEKLDLTAAKILEHRRALNMKKAVLTRRTLYQDTKKRRYDYQSLRFISLHDKHIGAMQIAITPLDASCTMDINTGIDTSVTNAGSVSEGRKRHFRIKELGQRQKAGYLVVETLEKKHIIVFWAGFYYEVNGKKCHAKDNIFRLKLKKGQTVKFTKIFYIRHFPCKRDHSSYKEEGFKVFNRDFRGRFSNLLSDHIRMWDKLWKRADIIIEADENIQKNLRFNIYHMLICAHYDKGFSSIGARTLSGEGYRGHIFWDAEIFLFPFYLFTFPKTAKNMLLYRCRRLDRAREIARREGYKGAKFPWESASSGKEETPEWAKDFDHSVIKIHTHGQEHHISADIAYAVYKYYVATKDEDFMKRYGYELLFETARFWASRVEFNKRKNRYEIRRVIGPDEFHKDVNNNAFTNMMAKWNLVTAYRLFNELKKRPSLIKKIKRKINLKNKEAHHWKVIGASLAVKINRKGVIEQFDGYFRLKKAKIKEINEDGIPVMPANLKVKDLGKSNLVKQADVLMLLYLLDDVFSLKTKMANYQYYINKTVHKSSLSPSINSLIAAGVGDLNRAYDLFNVSLHADIANLYDNTAEGIHAASLGGTWQALISGFAGVKLAKEKLSINPNLPRRWKKINFSLLFRGDTVNFELTQQVVKIKIRSKHKKKLALEIFNKREQARTNKSYTFRRDRFAQKSEEFY
jgi:kojibiose phosphorylase